MTTGQVGLGLVSWLVEQAIVLGPALLGSWFPAVGSMAHAMLGDGLQEVVVIGVYVQRPSQGPEASKGAERLQRSFETNPPGLTGVTFGRLGHGAANQVVDQEVGPDLLADPVRFL